MKSQSKLQPGSSSKSAWSKIDEVLGAAVYPYTPGAEPGSLKSAAAAPGAVAPGVVLLVGQGGKPVYHKAFGCRAVFPEVQPMHTDVVFDVAALTKVVVTTTLAMQLVDRGQLDVDRRLSHIFQTFGTHGKERMTVRHLLTHTSGYAATAPYFRQIAKADRGERAGLMTSRGAVETIYNEIFRAKLENLPGKATKYSDVGFILLGDAIEVISGMHLDKLVPRNVLKPLKLGATGFIDLTALRRQGLEAITDMIAPTAECPWRGRILCGEVHDDNAWAMGGVAAHAGLFSTAVDLHRFAAEMIECWHGRSTFIDRDVVREFWLLDDTDLDSSWALGWDTPAEDGSSAGRLFSPAAVGHNSYTGCSLWVDPIQEIDVVLLTNRLHPTLENNAIQSFRPQLHDLILEALGRG